MSCSTAVATACGNIEKLPSLVTQTHGRSGRASFRPSTPQVPKPMPAKPPGVNTLRGSYASQYCSTHVWWLPVSVIISVSSGAARAGQDAERALNRLGRARGAPLKVPRALLRLRRLHVAGPDPEVIGDVD